MAEKINFGESSGLGELGYPVSGVPLVRQRAEYDTGVSQTIKRRIRPTFVGPVEQLHHMGGDWNREEFINILALPGLLQEAERVAILGCLRPYEPGSRCCVDRRVFERNLKNYRRKTRRRLRILERAGRSLSRHRGREVYQRLQDTSEDDTDHDERTSGEFTTPSCGGNQ